MSKLLMIKKLQIINFIKKSFSTKICDEKIRRKLSKRNLLRKNPSKIVQEKFATTMSVGNDPWEIFNGHAMGNDPWEICDRKSVCNKTVGNLQQNFSRKGSLGNFRRKISV